MRTFLWEGKPNYFYCTESIHIYFPWYSVFMDSMLSFYPYESNQSSPISHTEPLFYCVWPNLTFADFITVVSLKRDYWIRNCSNSTTVPVANGQDFIVDWTPFGGSAALLPSLKTRSCVHWKMSPDCCSEFRVQKINPFFFHFSVPLWNDSLHWEVRTNQH